MSALADRDQYESAIVAGLVPIFQEQIKRASQARRLTDIDYGQFESDVRRVLSVELFKAFIEAGTVLVIGQSLVFSEGNFDDVAQRWCDSFARETASQVADTSQRLTREGWKLFQGDRRSPAQIEADWRIVLQGIYSPARMNAIAVTSVTAAASNGEHAVLFFSPENRQRRLVAVWMCVEDAPGIPAESVCPICAPFDRQSREVWGERHPLGPPLHPSCRCWLDWIEAAEWARRAA